MRLNGERFPRRVHLILWCMNAYTGGYIRMVLSREFLSFEEHWIRFAGLVRSPAKPPTHVTLNSFFGVSWNKKKVWDPCLFNWRFCCVYVSRCREVRDASRVFQGVRAYTLRQWQACVKACGQNFEHPLYHVSCFVNLMMGPGGRAVKNSVDHEFESRPRKTHPSYPSKIGTWISLGEDNSAAWAWDSSYHLNLCAIMSKNDTLAFVPTFLPWVISGQLWDCFSFFLISWLKCFMLHICVVSFLSSLYLFLP